MIYLFCGSIIGIVMGLTGAGGALVAIPLFMQFLGQDLKVASVYSLVAVVIASLMNYLSQRSATQYRTGLVIIASSALGSALTAPFKQGLSSFSVAMILAAVSLYALYSVWWPVEVSDPARPSQKVGVGYSLLVGFALGALTTFTGLGGGVLMLPILLALYRFSQAQAVATSLFAVGLSSLASLVVQVLHGAQFALDQHLLFLVLGILAAVVLLKLFLNRLPPLVATRLRQVVFTLVVLLALAKIF